MYQNTARVGLIKACLRYIEDPNRNIFARLFLALSPLFILWVISPLDIVPEVFLGPLGLADDSAIIVALFFLAKFAVSFYSEKRYIKRAKRPDEKDIIDI